MAYESRAKRARTAANGGTGGSDIDGVAVGASGQGGTHTTTSSTADAASSSGSRAAPASAGAASGSGSNGATASTVAAEMVAGGSPLDALPDELLGRVLFEVARRDWFSRPTCGSGEGSLLSSEDAEPDVQPKQLVQLKAVCRRFRRIVDDGSLWGRLALREPNDAAVEALTKLPEQLRKAVRRIVLRRGSVSARGLCKLAAAFRDQLEELSISTESAALFPVAGIASIHRMHGLRKLYLGIANVDSAYASVSAFAAPAVMQSLSVLSLLPNLQMLDLGIPLPVSVLDAFFRAKFTALERLELFFYSADSGLLLSCSVQDEDHLRPLCSLTQIQDVSIGVHLGWIGFISHMPQLQSFSGIVGSSMTGERADFMPLFAAPVLRKAHLIFHSASAEHAAAFASGLASSTSLEVADLRITLDACEALAARPLQSWAQLKRLGLQLLSRHREDPPPLIPGSFLKRLASDVPTLRMLTANSVLPVTTDLISISSLNFLAELRVSNEAAKKMSKLERQVVVSTLLDVRVSFSGIKEDEG
eukprot:tig00000219_g19455.t1